MKENTFFTVLMDVLLLIVFVSLARMVFNLEGLQEIQHLTYVFLLFLFGALSLIGVYKENPNSWFVLMIISLLGLIEVYTFYFIHTISFCSFSNIWHYCIDGISKQERRTRS